MKSKLMLIAFFGMLIMSSCSSVHRTLREPNVRVELERADFDLSPQVTATSTQTKIIGIDWKRLKHKETGSVDKGLGVISLASIPVIGDYIPTNPSEFALSELMKNNLGYDVVFYPQFEISESRPFLGIGFFKQITTVKVTARLGKLK
jgi:hypothetical protein